MTESKYKCKDCRHHITSKSFREYCWCTTSGHPTTQSIYHKACDKFEKLFILDALEKTTTHEKRG
jgi:hypothetical protein